VDHEGTRLDKSKLSETDIYEKFISPTLTVAGWDIHEQILREYPEDMRPPCVEIRPAKAVEKSADR
jgi:type I site-specific restriction endonuclease